jgi:hypothetical protein
MSDYKYISTVGNILVLRDDSVSSNWNVTGHDSAVKYLHSNAMANPNHRWRIVQVIAEVERAAPIIHTLMDNKS